MIMRPWHVRMKPQGKPRCACLERPNLLTGPERAWQNTGADTWGEYALVLVDARTKETGTRDLCVAKASDLKYNIGE